MSDGLSAAPTPEAIAAAAVAAPPAAVTPPTPAAPAALPAPAAEVIGAEPAAAVDTGVAYKETGDPGLDVALNFIGSMGLGPDHAAVIAAVDGDFTLLNATLEAMGDKAKGYQQFIALAKASHERAAVETAATQTAVTAAVNEAAGGADQWAAVKAWAGANADPAEKDAINAMLSAGPLQARAAAIMLAGLYADAGGTTVPPRTAASPNASPAANASGALSPADYATALRELRSGLGGRDLDSSPQYAALKARRLSWRG